MMPAVFNGERSAVAVMSMLVTGSFFVVWLNCVMLLMSNPCAFRCL